MKSRSIVAIFGYLILSLTACATAPVSGRVLADEYYNLGNEWFDLKKFDRAAVAYRNALSWNPELKIATINLARTKAELGDTTGALELLAPIAASDPENLVVAQYQAWLTAKQTGVASAADLYQALAARLSGDATTQFNAGLSLRAAARNEEARLALVRWKELDGKTSQGLFVLAEILEETQSPEAAEAWFEVVASYPEGDAKRFLPLTRRAKVLETAELFGDAVDAWTAALDLAAPSSDERGEARFRRGQLYLLQIEDYQSGSQDLLEAWKAGYKDPEAWKALRENPSLKFSLRLEADLKSAGIEP